MGLLVIDQYTLLHFATGVMAYFWGIEFKVLMIIHTIFELSENTGTGMAIINKITFWPGGKTAPDSNINILGDTLGAAAGWWSAYHLDKIYSMAK